MRVFAVENGAHKSGKQQLQIGVQIHVAIAVCRRCVFAMNSDFVA